MKWNIYNRSLLYAISLVGVVLILLKVLFPNLELFSSPKLIAFFLLSTVFAYITIILSFKKNYTSVTKKVLQKSNTTFEEQKQKQNLQLTLFEDREKYRREFLGNVSHELKTPLFAIQGYILTLIDGAMSDKQIRKKYLERINKSVERLIHIVQDLDMLAEMESGNLSMNQGLFDIKGLALEVFDLLEIKSQERGVKLQLEAPVPATMVYGDKKRIQQVLMNLISNAIYYSADKEPVVIVKIAPTPNQVNVMVEDNGRGIPKEHIDRVFERFYRIDTARSREDGGSGLGLAIVKNILQAHGQQIKIESKPNEGSVFSFALSRSH